MLKINYTEFRNFLSYGNQWTHFDIKSGIHLIVGEDIDRKRSNGSGKSSVLEPITYGLFGQTIKELTKSRIINWKNEKNCEVKINFIAITGDEVTIHRGMKPNIFEVWVNGDKLETTAKAPEFQKEIEESLIGMDFKTFSGIVHSNPNNSISLLNTKKEQKRQFLERLFNLESYSKMVKNINLKLRKVNDNIIATDSDQRNKLENWERAEKDVRTTKEELESIDITGVENEIDELHVALRILKSIVAYKYDVDKIEKDREDLRGQVSLSDIEKEGLKTERDELVVEQKTLESRRDDIGDLTEKREKVRKADARIAELELIDFKAEFANYDDEIRHCEDHLEKDEVERVKLSDERSIVTAEHSNLPSPDDLKGKPSCPTCGSEVDYETIKEETDDKACKLILEINAVNDKQHEVAERMDFYKGAIKKLEGQVSELKDKQSLLEKLTLVIEGVDLEGKEKDLDIIDKRLKKIYSEISTLDTKIEKIDDKQKETQQELSELRKQVREFEEASINVANQNQRISVAVEKLELHTGNRKRFEERLSNAEVERDKIAKEIKELDAAHKKSTTIKDYLTYIKTSLKDENVKQYAISSILPFLNRQTNHYLSETGHSFYLLIDGWMDAEIKGIGMKDCSFSNLSGGESKSIDLAIKFACIDIAKMMATASTNILILDEILDSSIDSYGIQQLVDIVYYKQKEDDLAVYVISHREEISELGFDSTIKVIKEDGYSRVEQE